MGERVAAAAYSLGWALIRWVPERAGRWVFTRLADWAWWRRGEGVRRLEANLGRVLGAGSAPQRLRSLSRAGMRSYLRYWYEFFRLSAMRAEDVRERTRCTGIEGLEATIASGRGVVAALPHMGNWDHAGAWITLRGVGLTTVAQRLKPERLYQRFVSFREGLGMEVLPLTGGSGVVGTLARRLRKGGLVCLLADRDLTAQGVEVDFFGEPARMPAGPASLALRTGAALMPVTLYYDGPYWGIRIHDEVPVPAEGDRAARVQAMTQETARVFAAQIAAHPEDWHMLQRVFSADLPDSAEHRPANYPDPLR